MDCNFALCALILKVKQCVTLTNTVKSSELYAALRSASTKRATGDCLERGMNFETSRGVVALMWGVGCPVERIE